MTLETKTSFTKQMRKATREIHDISDALVNAKLGIAMSDDSIWAEGILCFYEIFRYLEDALDRLNHTLLSELDIVGMRRTKAFEEDLHHFYGNEWLETAYEPNQTVKYYLDYLGTLERENPHMLAAYIYHLYMGLFSGGQILRKKRALKATLLLGPSNLNQSSKGESVTDFGDIPIHKLKKLMSDAMEHIAEQLGEEDRWKLIEESKNVFRLNNKIIRTINTNRVVVKKFVKFSCIAIPTCIVLYFGVKLMCKTWCS